MSWSKTPPTVPGWYGWRHSRLANAKVVEVFTVDFADGSHLCTQIPGSEKPYLHLDCTGGEWFSEPIKVPWEKEL